MIRNKKAKKFLETLEKLEEQDNLNHKQQALAVKTQTSLNRINNSYPLPHKPLYQGQPNILLGVSIQLEQPATIAIVDALTNKEIRDLR